MSSIDLSLLVNRKGGREVGHIGADVRGLALNLKVEVLGGVLVQLLALDLNALDGYGETNVVCQGLTGNELLGDVESGNVLLGGVNDSCGAALDLLHAGVRNNRPCNLNGHAELDAEIRNGILRQAVAVVAALALQICEEEVVVLVACCLGVDGNNDTLNNNIVVLGSCHVILKAGEVVLGNGEVECLGCAGAVCGLNGSGQRVSEFLGGLLVYVDGVGVVILLVNGNTLGNGPLNVIGNAGDLYLCGNVKVCCGDGTLVLIQVKDVGCCCGCVVGYLIVGVLRLLGGTSSEAGEAKHERQQGYKKFLHGVFSP